MFCTNPKLTIVLKWLNACFLRDYGLCGFELGDFDLDGFDFGLGGCWVILHSVISDWADLDLGNLDFIWLVST